MNVSFKEICRASVAEEWSRAGERVGKVIPQGGELFQNEDQGKGDEVTWKTRAKQHPKRPSFFEEDLGNSIKLQIILQCQL